MAICVFDVHEDGRVSVPTDQGLTGAGGYRWWHFDLSDDALVPFVRAHLPGIPAAALLQSETRPRCDRYDDGLILNLRGINLNAGQSVDQMVSVRIWATRDVIVTVRLRKVFALDEIRQAMLAQRPPATVGAFLNDLIASLTDRAQDQVLALGEQTDTFEDLAMDEDAVLPPRLGQTRRRVIKLRRYLEPQRAALAGLASSDVGFLTQTHLLHLREQTNRATLNVEALDALGDRLRTMQDHHDAQTSLRQSRNSYALSVVAAIFLPLGFVTGLFGVNLGGMPGVDNPWAFAWLGIGMVVIALVMAAVLRWLRWL
jgi:zinc transporter